MDRPPLTCLSFGTVCTFSRNHLFWTAERPLGFSPTLHKDKLGISTSLPPGTPAVRSMAAHTCQVCLLRPCPQPACWGLRGDKSGSSQAEGDKAGLEVISKHSEVKCWGQGRGCL